MAAAELLSLDAAWLRSVRANLLKWFARTGRKLPWRESADPYPIWISEIMLQQTTVVAVIPYFERFLARFPTLVELAQADEREVLKHWEGLGYYSRARNIHKTARLIVDEHAGRFPREVAALRVLPGIGRYTAGAIASFAFDQPAPILEANTLRVYCRLLGFADDPRTAAGQNLLWSFAERLVPRTHPGRINQALMELGQTLCTPTQPACERCPVRSRCAAFLHGAQEKIPQAARRPVITEVTETTVAIQRGARYLLMQRQPGERWAGLWDFLRFEGEAGSGSPRTLPEQVRRRTGVGIAPPELVTTLRHSVTRYRITLRCFAAAWREAEATGPGEVRWVHPREFSEYPLSVTARKFAKLLAARPPEASPAAPRDKR